MNELVSSAFAIALGMAVSGVLVRRLPRSERVWIWLSLGLHLAASCAKVWLVFHYYGDGDTDSYIRDARQISELIRMDPGRWLWTYLQMGLQFDVQVPYLPPGDSGSTRSVFAFTALHQTIFGQTRFGICLFVAVFSMASKVGVYLAFREHLPARLRPRVAAACLLIPSMVFWSAALGKEGLLWCFCGWVVYGFHLAFFKKRWIPGLALVLAAGYFSALFKAYVLIPMAIGAAVWLYWRTEGVRRRREPTPLRSIGMVLLVFGAASALVIGLGEAFPRYKVANFADEASHLQQTGERQEYGSDYSLGTRQGFVGQMSAAPAAALTALYRPLIVEAHNVLMLVAGVETTFFILLTFYILRERGFGVIRALRSSPALLFCVVYVLLFSVAVGLTSTNLGTLSRYRMPMMPFFGILFAALTPMRPQAPPRRVVRRPRRRGRTVVPLHAN